MHMSGAKHEAYDGHCLQGRRPHIFGMTASPLDQKSQGQDKTRQFFDELERNLDAKVRLCSKSCFGCSCRCAHELELAI